MGLDAIRLWPYERGTRAQRRTEGRWCEAQGEGRPSASQGSHAGNTLISDFWPPELSKNKVYYLLRWPQETSPVGRKSWSRAWDVPAPRFQSEPVFLCRVGQ